MKSCYSRSKWVLGENVVLRGNLFSVVFREDVKKLIFYGQAGHKRLHPTPLRSAFCEFFCVFFIFLTQTFSELESPLFRYVTWYYLSHPSPIIALPCPWRVKMLSSRNLSLNSCLDNGRWQRVWWQNSGIWIYIIHLRHHHAAISNPMLNRKRREVSSCILGNNSVTVLFEAFFFTVTLRALSAFSAWTGLSRIACKLLPMPPTSRIF